MDEWITKAKTIPKEKLLQLYGCMYRIRRFEEKLYLMFLSGEVPGTIHQSNGQEAVAAGVCENLDENDLITSTHRGHGHCIAKGIPLDEMLAEILGKKTGCSRGVGGTMHLYHREKGIFGTTGIVGSGVPVAVGLALGIKYKKDKRVVVSFFGEAAINQGSFHEAINLASIWDLPVIFICENNKYAVSTPIDEVSRITNLSERAKSYGIPAVTIDGNNVIEVYLTTKKAVERARNNLGPTFIECKTYRYKGHSRSDPAIYRSKEELNFWLKRDPIPRLRNWIIEGQIADEDKLGEIGSKVEIEMNQAVEFASKSPKVDPEEISGYLFA
ncbi:Acetoin:2,6-dichlorophenolindophenol oxidoreductase subunit alpha [subsurface metagenome]